MTTYPIKLSLEIDPIEGSDDEKALYIFQKLWASIPEEQLWIADENVSSIEARTGPSWMCRSGKEFTAPLPFAEALLELARFSSYRAGLLQFTSGARVFFSLMDEPRFSVRKIEVPTDGGTLSPAYTCELLER